MIGLMIGGPERIFSAVYACHRYRAIEMIVTADNDRPTAAGEIIFEQQEVSIITDNNKSRPVLRSSQKMSSVLCLLRMALTNVSTTSVGLAWPLEK
jgi:hypothetical protein